MKAILILMVILLIGCTQNPEKAERYKLDLQYYEYALKFLEQNLVGEAYDSCNRAVFLKNECLISIVQASMSNQSSVPEAWCYEIDPDFKVGISMGTFRLIYPDMAEELKNELKEKRNPSKERRERIRQIKEECLNIAE